MPKNRTVASAGWSGTVGTGADALVARLFTPAELDIDDLAEAIRRLLGPDAALPKRPAKQRSSTLLSIRHRGSHVLEANETP